MSLFTIHEGDCLQALRAMPDASVDAIVTDPPYGLSFMGKRWDYDVPSVEVWAECLRVLKPGGHLLAFAGTRTQHRMAVRIEDAGFEIRDMIAWVYGSGFPKSLDVSKAIDKAAGAEREKVPATGGLHKNANLNDDGWSKVGSDAPTMDGPVPAPATDAAKRWQGWGTALKPALEPITVARKPLVGTVAENVLAHGTGAINVDGCRVEGAGPSGLKPYTRSTTPEVYALGRAKEGKPVTYADHPLGRWPANLIHDGSGEPTDLLGDAARFFYCAKASKKDRNEGLEAFDAVMTNFAAGTGLSKNGDGSPRNMNADAKNHHPTVKPTDLMRYLCRLVTPPGGVVLDPFMGSGSTGKAALLEGFRFIGCERSPEYVAIARARIAAALQAIAAEIA